MLPPSDALADCVEYQTGYCPGLIGRITELHARTYADIAGFGRSFESNVAAGLAEFMVRLDNPRNEIWAAIQSGVVIGSVTIDGEDMAPDRAHLRWFIVDETSRSHGIGRLLLAQAVEFCDRHGFSETHLWTFQGLHAARKLYADQGFFLAEERLGTQWGKEVLEQRFVRLCVSPSAA